MYYVTITAKRKNAKRHIFEKGETIEEVTRYVDNINKCYIVELYNGKWQLIERIR